MKLNTALLLFLFVPSVAAVDLKPVDAESKVSFVIKNFGLNTNGQLKGLTGTIKWDEDNPSGSYFNVNVDANTINTGIDMRDDHLRKEEYFNIAKYPSINFTSTSVSNGNITGNLTIKGITRKISFPFTVTKAQVGYFFEGSFSINRKDFDVGSSSFSLSNSVDVTLKIKAAP